jgi:hypothetical protein
MLKTETGRHTILQVIQDYSSLNWQRTGKHAPLAINFPPTFLQTHTFAGDSKIMYLRINIDQSKQKNTYIRHLPRLGIGSNPMSSS